MEANTIGIAAPVNQKRLESQALMNTSCQEHGAVPNHAPTNGPHRRPVPTMNKALPL